jgi:hypothetical protein
MRKFYVVYYCYDEIERTTVELNHGEKANVVTFESKLKEMYNYYREDIHHRTPVVYCTEVLSWSLIEE